jgi:hypothetical protein
MPHFSLELADGTSLGTIQLGRPDNPPGSITWRGTEPNLRVVGSRDAGEDEVCPCWSSRRRERLTVGRHAFASGLGRVALRTC